MTIDESYLNKVRALLSKAESTPYPDEAEAFAAKAEELMLRHAIDTAMLGDLDPGKRDQLVTRGIRFENPHLNVKGAFLYQLGKALGCKGAYRVSKALDPDGKTYFSIMDMVGFETDVDWVETLFTSLEMQRLNALTTAIKTKRYNEHGRTFTQAFNELYRTTVVSRVKKTMETVVSETPSASSGASTALVLVERAEQVDAEYRKQFPWAKERQRTVQVASASGAAAGRRAGSAANIARGSVGGVRGALR